MNLLFIYLTSSERVCFHIPVGRNIALRKRKSSVCIYSFPTYLHVGKFVRRSFGCTPSSTYDKGVMLSCFDSLDNRN